MERKRWYKDMVFYQIWPRSFKDGDGDGMVKDILRDSPWIVTRTRQKIRIYTYKKEVTQKILTGRPE